MRCPNCGFDNREEAKFCAQCGKALQEETAEQEETQATTESESLLTESEPSVEAGASVPETAEEIPSPPAPRPPSPVPLPEGALLLQRRYEILAFVQVRDSVNEYRAVETEPRKRCLNCRTLNTADSNFCEQCGSDLTEAEQVQVFVRLLESYSAEALQPFWQMAERGLHHPAIAAPLAAFEETPYDRRTYVALSEIVGTPLQEVSPEDAPTAFAWVHLIADAFGELAANGFGLKEPLQTAFIFTDQGEPFLRPEAVSLEPTDWEPVRQTFATIVQKWLKEAQGEQWLPNVQTAFEQASDWHDLSLAFKRLAEIASAPPSLTVTFAAATDVGRRREHNEDSYLTLTVERCHLDKKEVVALLAVADGMGGHAAGEVASKLCLQVFAAHLLPAIQDWLHHRDPNWHAALKEAATEANRQVFAEAQALRNNMGTTLTAAIIAGNKVVFVNVGDSRGYVLQDGKLRQITKDHSLVQQYVDAGLLTPEEARWHPQRNIITQAIGIEPTVQADIFEVSLRPNDLVLLCSDGLVDMVDDAEIERVLLSEPDLTAAAQTLVRLANDAGGDDNITVLIARVM